MANASTSNTDTNAAETAAATETAATETANADTGASTGGNGNTESKSENASSLNEGRVQQLISEGIASALKEYATQQQKAQTEAEKLKNMTDAEKTAYERDALKKELDAMKREKAISGMQDEARAILTDKGYHVPDGVLKALVTEDAAQTKTNVEQFASMLSELVTNEVARRLKSEPPKKGDSHAPGITKEQIFAEKDGNKRLKLIQEHMDLFTDIQ